MKKFLTLIAAGTVAFSLTAVTLIAETGAASIPLSCDGLSGAPKYKCLRDRQSQKLLDWRAKRILKVADKPNKEKMMQQIQKHVTKRITRITRRTILKDLEKREQRRMRHSSSMMSSNMSSMASSLATSSMGSSSSSVMSSSASSVSSQ